MDMRFGMWNVRIVYRTGLLKMAQRELGKYKLDLVGVQAVRWKRVALRRQRVIHSSVEKIMKIISYEQDFLYIKESYHHLGE
jgi:hypothetical protein